MLSSPVDMVLIGVAALLIFGPKRLPELGKSLGQGLGNFKKALTDASDGLNNPNPSSSPKIESPKDLQLTENKSSEEQL